MSNYSYFQTSDQKTSLNPVLQTGNGIIQTENGIISPSSCCVAQRTVFAPNAAANHGVRYHVFIAGTRLVRNYFSS